MTLISREFRIPVGSIVYRSLTRGNGSHDIGLLTIKFCDSYADPFICRYLSSPDSFTTTAYLLKMSTALQKMVFDASAKVGRMEGLARNALRNGNLKTFMDENVDEMVSFYYWLQTFDTFWMHVV